MSNDARRRNDPDTAWKESEKSLSRRIARTSSLIWRIEAGAALLSILSAAFLLLLFGVVLDHLFLRGLSQTGRWVYASCASVFLLAFAVCRFLPLIRFRINPLYSAGRIEDAFPSLKSGLVNWFLLRRAHTEETDRLSREFRRNLSVKTDAAIPEGAEENAVDTKPIFRWGMALVVSAALLSAYTVFSVKSPFVSAVRVILPSAPIEAPQSVRFVSVEPGNKALARGEQVEIRAEITGVRSAPVFLLYSTADSRLTNRVLPMEPRGGNFYAVLFPEPESGLTETVDYRVVVGEGESERGRSKEYRLSLRPPISFKPVSAVYQFPKYTGLSPKTVEEWDGNIEACAGTKVTITAECSGPMSRAVFVPDYSPERALSMKIDSGAPNRAALEFELSPKCADWKTYQLVCADEEKIPNIVSPYDSENGEICWNLRVTEDPPPAIEWEKLPEVNEIPQNEPLGLELKAADSEFGLKEVRLELSYADTQGENIEKEEIEPVSLFESAGEPGSDPRELKLTVSEKPYKYGLDEGDVVECRAAAYDNKGNRAETEPITFTVGKPKIQFGKDSSGEEEEDKDGGGDSGEQGENGAGGNAQNGGNADQSEQGEAQPENGGEDGQEGESESNGDGTGESGSNDSEQGTGEEGEPEKNEGENGGAEGELGNAESEGNTGETGEGESNGEGKKPGGADGSGTPNESDSAGGGGSGGAGTGPGEGNSSPVDPDTDPGGAFETIIDFFGADVETGEAAGDPTGKGTGVESDGPKRNAESDRTDPRQIRSGEGESDGGKRQTDSVSGELPENAGREQGNVDPNTRNYMVTAGNGNETGDAPVPADANVTADPNLNRQGTDSGAGGSDGKGNGENGAPGGEGTGGEETEGKSNHGAAENGTPENGESAESNGQVADLEGAGEGENGDSGNPAKQARGPNAEKIGNTQPKQGGGGIGEFGEGTDAAPADRANLRYTEKATALALTRLDEQIRRGKIDKELLGRLGWTEEDLREFHRRWSEMSGRAMSAPADSAERRQYEEELRDLGLRPRGGTGALNSSLTRTHSNARGVHRTPPPPEYRERFKSYNQRISGSPER